MFETKIHAGTSVAINEEISKIFHEGVPEEILKETFGQVSRRIVLDFFNLRREFFVKLHSNQTNSSSSSFTLSGKH